MDNTFEYEEVEALMEDLKGEWTKLDEVILEKVLKINNNY